MIVPPLHHVKSQLILLEIYQTKIPDIPNDFFHGFERLYYLIIFGCNLRAIPNLNGVSRSIVSIDLRENKIVHIDSFYRTYFPKLGTLRLDSNFIAVVDFEAISKWPKLRMLNLSKNKISKITVPASITNLLILISDNPLVRDDMPWLRYCKCLEMTQHTPGMITCRHMVRIFTQNLCFDMVSGNANSDDAGKKRTLPSNL